MSLRCSLTVGEVAERATFAAELVLDLEKNEEARKAAAAHAKIVSAEISAEIRRLSCEVRTGATYRIVDCHRIHDYAAGLLREVRTDTGEELSTRPLTGAERQPALPFAADDKEGNADA